MSEKNTTKKDLSAIKKTSKVVDQQQPVQRPTGIVVSEIELEEPEKPQAEIVRKMTQQTARMTRKATSGSAVTRQLSRGATFNWLNDADQRVFDIDEVQKELKYMHPHIEQDGAIELVPLDKEEGVLDWNFDPRKPEIIEVGKTVSVYLKFLSSMAWVMVLVMIFSLPLVILYSTGNGELSTGMGELSWVS